MLGYPLDTVIQLAIPEGSQSSLAPPFTSEHPGLMSRQGLLCPPEQNTEAAKSVLRQVAMRRRTAN